MHSRLHDREGILLALDVFDRNKISLASMFFLAKIRAHQLTNMRQPLLRHMRHKYRPKLTLEPTLPFSVKINL